MKPTGNFYTPPLRRSEGRWNRSSVISSMLRVRLDWEELRAGDVAGCARAFQSLVQGGMAIEDAARVSGVLMQN